MEVRSQHYAPAALPPGKKPAPLNRRLSGPKSRPKRFGEEKNLLPLAGFGSRTVELVASRFTDCTIRETRRLITVLTTSRLWSTS